MNESLNQKLHSRHLWKVGGIVFFCFVAGFLGAWAALQSGLVTTTNSKSISENRNTVVLQEGEVIADASKKISPSVVSVRTQMVTQSAFGSSASEGAGTGIIVSKDGYVVTNKHVVPDGTEKVSVVTSDGKTFENVRVIGRDPVNDLAFLKIDGVDNLTPATLGDSDKVQVGQKAIAVGNALGEFQNTVTQGIISGKGRPVTASDGSKAESLTNLFQTDAAINPGNSGGPLININGEVIGINVAVAQGAEGIGFAIPINDAKSLIEGVIQQGTIVRPYLGVQYVMLNVAVAKQLNASRESGALVYAGGEGEAVVVGSPAEKAGLKRGDIVIKVNGQEVNEENPLASRLNRFKPGDSIDLTVVRDGQEQTLKATLEQYK